MKTCSFVLQNQKIISLPLKSEILRNFPDAINDQLMNFYKYHIQANVKFEVFQLFLDYYIKKQNIPDIDASNFIQYYQLSIEFKFTEFTNFLSDQKYSNIHDLSVLQNISSLDNFDKSLYEEKISKNLDFYLAQYPDEMTKIHITSLYNIFNNKECKLQNHEKAYQFITKSLCKNNPNAFILLECLDGSKLSKITLNESLSSKALHLRFVPKFNFSSKRTIKVLYITVENFNVVDFNFIQNLNEKNDLFQINITKIFDTNLIQILKIQKDYMQLYDMIMIGGCDLFYDKTKILMNENVFKEQFRSFHEKSGIILLLHDAYVIYSNIYGVNPKNGGFLKFINYRQVKIFKQVQFNKDCGKDDIISIPFNLFKNDQKNFDVSETHQAPINDQNFTVFFNGDLSYQYYVENINENIGNIELGHKVEITESEKYLIYNIICHLYNFRNEKIK